MEIVALIGPSGTGKSYRAILSAKELNIEYIIDDGLLIKRNNIIAGKSAKREGSSISAVKRALFMDEHHRLEVKKVLEASQPEKLLILGTSEKMIERITRMLLLPQPSKKIFIEDISSKEEIMAARKQRIQEGKHVIPVPTFQIKKDFSGYFKDTLKVLMKREDKDEQFYEKTVVRPTYSYLGKYTIADSVIKDLTSHTLTKMTDILKIFNIYIKTTEQGIIIRFDINILYGKPIIPIVKELQRLVISEVEAMTSLNILSVDVYVKKMTKT